MNRTIGKLIMKMTKLKSVDINILQLIFQDHFMGGLVIPKIPGVQTDILNIVKDVYSDPNTFYSKLNDIMETNVIKCLLIFLTDKECVEQENYVKKMVSDVRTK